MEFGSNMICVAGNLKQIPGISKTKSRHFCGIVDTDVEQLSLEDQGHIISECSNADQSAVHQPWYTVKKICQKISIFLCKKSSFMDCCIRKE